MSADARLHRKSQSHRRLVPPKSPAFIARAVCDDAGVYARRLP